MRPIGRLALLLCLLASASAASPLSRQQMFNQRLFDRVWSLVADRYWDRSMGGNDWVAVRDRFHPQALAARDEQQLYDVVNRMLDQLDDSHVYATSPSDLAWSREPASIRHAPPGRRASRLDGGILLLGFDQFDPGDDRWIARTIAGMADSGANPRGVILDLRNNGGGRDDVLDRIAGLFTTQRQLLIRLSGKRVIEESTRGAGPGAYRGPLAVIVGPKTASAAEILAFFLAETGRADSVGERTASAVTGGVDYDLPGGGQLTVAEYDIRTANGTRLEGNGFTPRYPVRATAAPDDAALAKAVALVRRRAATRD